MTGRKHVSKTNFEKLDASEGIPDDESPEVTEEDLARAVFSIGNVVIRGPRVRGRPLGSGKKEAIKMRIDKDILAHYRATGRGWQTRLNDALRASLMMAFPHKPSAKSRRKPIAKPRRTSAYKRKRAS